MSIAVSTLPRSSRHVLRMGVAITYVVCWLIGLGIGSPSVVVGDTGREILAAYAGEGTARLQAVIVHGAAGFLILAFALLVGRSTRRMVPIAAAGAAAALLSWVQLGCELVLTGAPSAERALSLWTIVTVVDGAKMLALAALTASLMGSVPGRGRRPSDALWLATTVALLASGVGYLGQMPGLMTAAFVSLPLLLVSTVVGGWAIGRSDG